MSVSRLRRPGEPGSPKERVDETHNGSGEWCLLSRRPNGHGAPLLLLHGWPELWLTWEPVMARLADRYRLIAPDLRGFGESDKPDGPFGAQDHAADVLALLDALGSNA